MTTDYPPILDTVQVAQLLGWDILKVRQAARTGVLPAYRLPKGRRYRFLRDEIVEWVGAQSGTDDGVDM